MIFTKKKDNQTKLKLKNIISKKHKTYYSSKKKSTKKHTHDKQTTIKEKIKLNTNELKAISLHKEDISRLTNEINLSISERLGKDFTLKMD